MEFQIFKKFQYLIYIQNLQISSLFLLKELIDEMQFEIGGEKNLHITSIRVILLTN